MRYLSAIPIYLSLFYLPLFSFLWLSSLTVAMAQDTPGEVGQIQMDGSDLHQAEMEDNSAERYEQAMRIGYAATEQQDYQTALINFRRALEVRPGDRYATIAISNVESYIERIRAEEARKRETQTLQTQLNEAATQRDWICATAIVDRLITLVPANSMERGRLVAYRGQLSGLLDARTDSENWSTVCPGPPPNR